MKKILHIQFAIILCCIAFTSAGQTGQWKIVNTGTTKSINDISIVNTKTAYAIGDHIFLKTTDGGDSWTDISANLPFASCQSVFFVDENIGFLGRASVSGGYTLSKTTDGGKTWANVSPSGMIHGVHNLFFSDATTGYATGGFGNGNAFTASANGGSVWNNVAKPSQLTSKALYFTSKLVGFSGADTLMKTTDGGNTWISTGIVTHDTNAIVDILFVDSQTGFAITDNVNVVFKTTDGGNNWAAIATGVSGVLGKNIFFSDANTGYVVAFYIKGVNNKPLVTTNGGLNWQTDTTFPNSTVKLGCGAAKNGLVLIGTLDGKIIKKKTAVAGVEGTPTNKYAIYPNPVSTGSVSIDNPENEPLQITVYNALGQQVAQYTNVQSGFQVKLAPALYHCQILDTQGNASIIKLIVN